MKLSKKYILAVIAAVAVLVATVLGARVLLAESTPEDPMEDTRVSDVELQHLTDLDIVRTFRSDDQATKLEVFGAEAPNGRKPSDDGAATLLHDDSMQGLGQTD